MRLLANVGMPVWPDRLLTASKEHLDRCMKQ